MSRRELILQMNVVVNVMYVIGFLDQDFRHVKPMSRLTKECLCPKLKFEEWHKL
jgi:hypothetical protein